MWKRSWWHGQCPSVWEPIKSGCKSKSWWEGEEAHYETFWFKQRNDCLFLYFQGRWKAIPLLFGWQPGAAEAPGWAGPVLLSEILLWSSSHQQWDSAVFSGPEHPLIRGLWHEWEHGTSLHVRSQSLQTTKVIKTQNVENVWLSSLIFYNCRLTGMSVLSHKVAVKWCLVVDTKWPTWTLRGQARSAFGGATFSWVSSIWKIKPEKLWVKTDGYILEIWGR